MEISRKIVIHAIAECSDCSFWSDDYRAAIRLGYAHAAKTGHQVHLETGRVWTYNRRQKETAGEAKPRPPNF